MTTPQPIATAPKGKRILLYCPRKIASEGWWQIGTFDEDTRQWIDDDYEPQSMLVQPTHWMPWPPAPITEESSATRCGQSPQHQRDTCTWWQIGRCPTACIHSATRLDL